jgi:hypothetical protein
MPCLEFHSSEMVLEILLVTNLYSVKVEYNMYVEVHCMLSQLNNYIHTGLHIICHWHEVL